MFKRFLVAVPIAAAVTGGMFYAMWSLTHAPPAHHQFKSRLVFRIGRPVKDTEFQRKRRPIPHGLDGGRPPCGDGCARPVSRPPPRNLSCGNGRGEVVLDFAVEVDGSLSDIKVISATSSCFADAAVRTLREWRYRPKTVDGKPVRSRTYVKITFEQEQ